VIKLLYLHYVTSSYIDEQTRFDAEYGPWLLISHNWLAVWVSSAVEHWWPEMTVLSLDRIQLNWIKVGSQFDMVIRVITDHSTLTQWSLIAPDSTRPLWMSWVESYWVLWSHQRLQPTSREPVFLDEPMRAYHCPSTEYKHKQKHDKYIFLK